MKRGVVSGREVSSPPVPEPEPTVPFESTVRPARPLRLFEKFSTESRTEQTTGMNIR